MLQEQGAGVRRGGLGEYILSGVSEIFRGMSGQAERDCRGYELFRVTLGVYFGRMLMQNPAGLLLKCQFNNVQQGAKAVCRDVYQESEAGSWAEAGGRRRKMGARRA